MPDLNVLESVTVRGPPNSTEYVLTRTTERIYECSCMWRRGRNVLHTVAEAGRTCRHLIEYRGLAEEATRIRSAVLSPAARATLLATLPARIARHLREALETQARVVLVGGNQHEATWNDTATTSTTIYINDVAAPSSTAANIHVSTSSTSGSLWVFDRDTQQYKQKAEKPAPKPPEPPTTVWDRLLKSPFGND